MKRERLFDEKSTEEEKKENMEKRGEKEGGKRNLSVCECLLSILALKVLYRWRVQQKGKKKKK